MALPDFDRARAWLFDDALPFWAEVGVDRTRGGFHEALDLSGRPLPGGFRRLRVACRQIYAFSHGALLGWAPGLPLARAGFAWLVEKGWQGADRGWARRLTPEGEVCDGTPDLYDHAFVLFALAWLYRAGGDPEALDGAQGLLRAGRVRVLSFEYNGVGSWAGARTLREEVERLDALGLDCFWMQRSTLLRLTGTCWAPAYETRSWSNVLCVPRTEHWLGLAAEALVPDFGA